MGERKERLKIWGEKGVNGRTESKRGTAEQIRGEGRTAGGERGFRRKKERSFCGGRKGDKVRDRRGRKTSKGDG